MLYFKTNRKINEKTMIMTSSDVLWMAFIMGFTGIDDLYDGGEISLLAECVPERTIRRMAEKIPTIVGEYKPTVVELVWEGRFVDAQDRFREAVGCTNAEAEDAVDAIWQREGGKSDGHSVVYCDINGDGIF